MGSFDYCDCGFGSDGVCGESAVFSHISDLLGEDEHFGVHKERLGVVIEKRGIEKEGVAAMNLKYTCYFNLSL